MTQCIACDRAPGRCGSHDESPLRTYGEPVRYRAEEEIWARGERSDFVLFLCRGVAIVSTVSQDGAERVLDLRTSGSMLGLSDVLEGGARAARATMVGAGAGWIVRADAIRALVDAGGPGALLLVNMAAQSMRALAARVMEVGYGNVDERVARVFVRLADEHGLPDARGMLVPVRLKRAQLAAMVGCRSETLVRTLREEGLARAVTLTREGVVIHDLKGLRRMAGR